jgi:hypothetical protein
MTLSGYQRSGPRKRSNLRRVKHAASKLFATTPGPLTIQQIRQAGQVAVKEQR